MGTCEKSNHYQVEGSCEAYHCDEQPAQDALSACSLDIIAQNQECKACVKSNLIHDVLRVDQTVLPLAHGEYPAENQEATCQHEQTGEERMIEHENDDISVDQPPDQVGHWVDQGGIVRVVLLQSRKEGLVATRYSNIPRYAHS